LVDSGCQGGCRPLKPLSFAAAIFGLAMIWRFCCLIEGFDLLGTFWVCDDLVVLLLD